MKKIGIITATALCASMMAVNAAAYQPCSTNNSLNSLRDKLNSFCISTSVLNCDPQIILQNIFGSCTNVTLPQKPQQPEQKPEQKPEQQPETPVVPEKPVIPETPAEPENPVVPENPGSGNTAESDGSVSEYERRVVELVNAERAKYGLSTLKINNELSRVARAKSQDMRDNGYFSHNSPTYGSPFDMLKSFGISYRAAGENIARGYSTPEAVVTGWMNSEGHRANILSSSFTQIGVGHVESGNYWTQLFIG